MNIYEQARIESGTRINEYMSHIQIAITRFCLPGNEYTHELINNMTTKN